MSHTKNCSESNTVNMENMEIERKFLVKKLPDNLSSYSFHLIEQAYLNTNPVIRIRRQDEDYYLTYKGKGLLAREEYNLPLNKESYYHLLEKADGNIISKKRYLIPLVHPDFRGTLTADSPSSLLIELDIFEAPFCPLIIAEVEFTSETAAKAFIPPDWFGQEVTENPAYHNSNLSRQVFPS